MVKFLTNFFKAKDYSELKPELIQVFLAGFDQAMAFAFVDADGKIIHLNSPASKLIGYSFSEVEGKYIADLCFDKFEIDDRVKKANLELQQEFPTVTEGFFSRAKKFGKDEQDWTGIKKDGQRFPLGTSVISVNDLQSKVSAYLVLLKDLTEKRKMEQELNRQKVRLMTTAKFSALGEMAGGVSHEINNPLQILVGKLHQVRRLILEPKIDVPAVLADLDKLSATTMRISNIINGMKTFSRNAEHDPFIKADLASIIEPTLDLCHGRFRDNDIDLRVKNVPKVSIECRPAQISQVILNLLNNSFDAIRPLQEKWIEVSIEEYDQGVRISVTDSGQGIPESLTDKLAEPFFTTKPVGQGTGLGLSISQGIVEGHSGIFMLDTDCPNTRFVVDLPKHQDIKALRSA